MTVSLSTIPSILGREPQDYEEEFADTVERIYEENKASSYSKSQREELATIACHNAYRAGDQLTRHEMREVVDELRTVKKGAFNCPHGRPILSGLGEASRLFPDRNRQVWNLL